MSLDLAIVVNACSASPYRRLAFVVTRPRGLAPNRASAPASARR